ncbi:hypothetical protein EVAR_95501_1 [Eumeta japonica]|uniref:Uncharacterized protein n=1 Tax=Eumeta variegata TaxID=151549 RepID=A0A4C1UJI6_EUMVA|nr:hypothetical protein EVAR_95501_1 [Eumeta japonica]
MRGREPRWSLPYDCESVYRAHVALIREICEVHGHTPSNVMYAAYMCRRMRHLQIAAKLVHSSQFNCRPILAPLGRALALVSRLKLQAAVLGVRLPQSVAEGHDEPPFRLVYWSDSKTVLTWIRTRTRNYKAFVAHLLAEIEDETKTIEWR